MKKKTRLRVSVCVRSGHVVKKRDYSVPVIYGCCPLIIVERRSVMCYVCQTLSFRSLAMVPCVYIFRPVPSTKKSVKNGTTSNAGQKKKPLKIGHANLDLVNGQCRFGTHTVCVF